MRGSTVHHTVMKVRCDYCRIAICTPVLIVVTVRLVNMFNTA